MDRVFADSSGFIAVFSGRDMRHVAAEQAYRRLISARLQIVTTNHVVDEVCGWLRKYGRQEHQSAVRFGEFVLRSMHPVLPEDVPHGVPAGTQRLLVYSTPDIERLAWDIFTKYDTAGFSFTDCVSFAVMRELGIRKAFTYDEHFEMMGFERIG